MPPVKELRWKPPVFGNLPGENLPQWEGHLDAVNRTKRCLQKSSSQENRNLLFWEPSEDCLHLHIATANLNLDNSKTKDQLYPVLVYIHGGSFQVGSGQSVDQSAPVIAAENNIVAVNLNYRLNVLGFLGVEDEFLGEKSVGNFGYMDQYAGLAWVKNYIHLFGGDADRITIAGESAGATSSMHHVIWEKSRQEFDIKGAIPLSVPIGIPVVNLNTAESMMLRLGRAFNCVEGSRRRAKVNIDCLRNVPAQKLVDEFIVPIGDNEYILAAAEPWPPIVDGSIVIEQQVDYVPDTGLVLPPTLAVTETEEAEVVIKFIAPENELSEPVYNLIATIFKAWNPKLANFTDIYPYIENDPVTSYDNIRNMLSDVVFYCPWRKVANTQQQTHHIVWQRPISIPRNAENDASYANCTMNACHSDEGQWFFGDNLMIDQLQKFYPKIEDRNFKNLYDDNGKSNWERNFGEKDIPINQVDLDLGKKFRKLVADFVTDPKNFEQTDSFVGYFNSEHEYTTRFVSREGDFDGVVENWRSSECDYWDELDIYGRIVGGPEKSDLLSLLIDSLPDYFEK